MRHGRHGPADVTPDPARTLSKEISSPVSGNTNRLLTERARVRADPGPSAPDRNQPKYATMAPMRTHTLLGCGAVGGPLFVLVFLAEGAFRDHYDPIRHPVSSLALGPSGWTQVVNFIATGLLMLAFAFGLKAALHPGPGSVWGPPLVGAYAIGLIGAGVFLTDPVSGYPPGTPDAIEYTWHGVLHDLFSIPVFLALPAACFVLGRAFRRGRHPGWAAYSMATGIGLLAAFVLASLAFGQVEGLVEVGGLLQRCSLLLGGGWITLLALHLRRDHRDGGADDATGRDGAAGRDRGPDPDRPSER